MSPERDPTTIEQQKIDTLNLRLNAAPARLPAEASELEFRRQADQLLFDLVQASTIAGHILAYTGRARVVEDSGLRNKVTLIDTDVLPVHIGRDSVRLLGMTEGKDLAPLLIDIGIDNLSDIVVRADRGDVTAPAEMPSRPMADEFGGQLAVNGAVGESTEQAVIEPVDQLMLLRSRFPSLLTDADYRDLGYKKQSDAYYRGLLTLSGRLQAQEKIEMTLGGIFALIHFTKEAILGEESDPDEVREAEFTAAIVVFDNLDAQVRSLDTPESGFAPADVIKELNRICEKLPATTSDTGKKVRHPIHDALLTPPRNFDWRMGLN